MRRLTREWVRKAETDLRVAQLADRALERMNDAICFHWQQSAEKYLKALVQESGQPVPRTHNLIALQTLLLPVHPTLRPLGRGLGFMTRFAVDARYPGHAVTRRQATSALRWAGRVRDACRAILGLPRPPRRRGAP